MMRSRYYEEMQNTTKNISTMLVIIIFLQLGKTQTTNWPIAGWLESIFVKKDTQKPKESMKNQSRKTQVISSCVTTWHMPLCIKTKLMQLVVICYEAM